MGGARNRDSLTLPPALLAGVRTALERLEVGARVVLAVSGGPDSVGMAWLVAAARPDLSACVVHVRHGLRDDAEDAAAAVATARALGMGWRVLSVDGRGEGAGPEDAARRARFAALTEAAVKATACAVLVGHTADDQAETVLLNIARGAGLPGLAGIPAWRSLTPDISLGRPVLALRRADVGAVARGVGVPVAADPTNHDPDQRRARARHALLPHLAELTGANTDPVVALERLARHARRDTAALDAIAAEHFGRLVQRWGSILVLATAPVDALPAALATRVVRRLVTAGGHPPSAATVSAVCRLRDGQALSIAGGGVVSRGGGYLAAAATPPSPLPQRSGMTRVDLPEAGVAVVRAPVPPARPLLPPWAPSRAATAIACAATGTLCVRAARPGDRIRSAAGTQKLSDAMAGARVPRLARGLVPVIEDGLGILWVPGVAVRAGAAGSWRLYLGPLAGQ